MLRFNPCKFKIGYSLFALIILLSSNCKKFVDIPPPQTQLTSSNVFNSDATALAAQSAIYGKMTQGGDDFTYLISYPSFSADELINYSTGPTDIQLYSNELTSNNVYIQSLWGIAYNYIYQANAVLEGVNAATGISMAVKQQLTGEAEFMRAFWHFYLVNLFGDVPLVTTTTYQLNNVETRTPTAQVYEGIIKDLKDAEGKLNANFVASDGITMTNDRQRPTRSAATAFLARVYLYTKDWANAKASADNVIGNPTFSLDSLSQVFLMNSTESIWQVGYSPYNPYEAYYFILTGPPIGNGQSISSQLINAFEPKDARRTNWIDSIISGGTTYYFPYKYQNNSFLPPPTEYESVLRLSEQYLIRSEAEAELGDSTNAIKDLNIIRNRASLPNYLAIDQRPLLSAILHERQVEFFTEFGHRWFDLKRTGNVDAVMSSVTPTKGGGTWLTNQQLYPIPLSEIKLNSKLSQNMGY